MSANEFFRDSMLPSFMEDIPDISLIFKENVILVLLIMIFICQLVTLLKKPASVNVVFNVDCDRIRRTFFIKQEEIEEIH